MRAPTSAIFALIALWRPISMAAVVRQAPPAPTEGRGITLVQNPSEPTSEGRVALVIGNSAYTDAPLKNPVNDSRDVSEALSRCGFKVTKLENANRTEMFSALRNFGQEIQRGGVGLFYFAGHGMQVRGKNYLIPVGADIAQEDEVPAQALEVDLVLAKMESAKNRLNVLILDACRNNPFGRSFRSASSGLAQMDAPEGTYIAFATAPGRVAADGSGSNGLFTQHLLANLETPGLKIEEVFKRVRGAVIQDSGKRQMPWDSSSLTGDFYFRPEGTLPPPKTEPPQQASSPAPPLPTGRPSAQPPAAPGEATFNRAAAAFNAGKFLEAKSILEELLRTDPVFEECHFLLAMCQFSEGNLKGTKVSLQKYLELAPNGKNAAVAREMLADPSLKNLK